MARAVVMQRRGIGGSTEGNQQPQSQEIMHRVFSIAGWGCEAAHQVMSTRPGVGSRSSERFGCINMRSLLSSLLVVVSKGLKLTRNRPIRHGFGSAEQSLCCFSLFAASL